MHCSCLTICYDGVLGVKAPCIMASRDGVSALTAKAADYREAGWTHHLV
jgi:hypothetical protein